MFNRRGFIGSLVAGVAAVVCRPLLGASGAGTAIPAAAKNVWTRVSVEEYLDWLGECNAPNGPSLLVSLVTYQGRAASTVVDEITISIGGEYIDDDDGVFHNYPGVFVKGHSNDGDRHSDIGFMRLDKEGETRQVCELSSNRNAGRWTQDGATVTCRRVVKGIPT